MIATCNNCKGSGEIDSGAPDPQGHFINIACNVCGGLGSLDTGVAEIDSNCCGLDIYICNLIPPDTGQHFIAVAVDPDWKTIVDSDYDEDVLRKRLCQTYW